MNTFSDPGFLRFGRIAESGVHAARFPTEINLLTDQSYTGDSLRESIFIQPLSGIGSISLQCGENSSVFFFDRGVFLNAGVSFCIYSVGDVFCFQIDSDRSNSFLLCKKNASFPSEDAYKFYIHKIWIQLSRHEERGCFIPENRHNLYELCYMESGHLFHVIEGQTYLLGPGELQFFLPNQKHHQYGYQEEAATFFTLIFSADFSNACPLTNKIFGLTSDERHLLSLLQEESLQARIFSSALCKSYLTQLIISLQRQIYDLSLKSPVGGTPMHSGMASAEIVSTAIRILNKTPGIKAESLARQLGVSNGYLSRLVSQQTGKSISLWRKEIRMESAKDLLRGGNSVGETAMALQYPSTAYFSSEFSKFWGISPRAYAKQFQRERK